MSHTGKSNSVFIGNGFNWDIWTSTCFLWMALNLFKTSVHQCHLGKARFQDAELTLSCLVPQLKHSVLLCVPTNLHIIKMVALSSVPRLKNHQCGQWLKVFFSDPLMVETATWCIHKGNRPQGLYAHPILEMVPIGQGTVRVKMPLILYT